MAATLTLVGNTILLQIVGHQPVPPTRLMRDTSIPPSGLAPGWSSGADTTTSSATLTPAGDTILQQIAGQQPARPKRPTRDTSTPPSGLAAGWLSGAEVTM